jgi:hypothetical protein
MKLLQVSRNLLTVPQCDPSHRRGAEPARSFTSSTTTPTTASSRSQDSPSCSSSSLSSGNSSTPSSSQQQATPPPFDTTPLFNTIDDFVLFPEDSVLWNDLDLEMIEKTDLSHFNFDINELVHFPGAEPSRVSLNTHTSIHQNVSSALIKSPGLSPSNGQEQPHVDYITTSNSQNDFAGESSRQPATFALDQLEYVPDTRKNSQSHSIGLLTIHQTYKERPVTCPKTQPFSQFDPELFSPTLASIPQDVAGTVATSKISLRQPPTPVEFSSTTSPALLAPSSQSLTSEPGAYRPANTEPRTSLVPVTPTLAYRSGSSAGFSLVMTALMKVMISLGSLILVALSLSLANNNSLLAAWTKSSMAVASCLSSTFRMMGRRSGLKSHPNNVNLLRLSV